MNDDLLSLVEHKWPLSVGLTRCNSHWHAIRNALASRMRPTFLYSLAALKDTVGHLRSSAHLPGGHIFGPFNSHAATTSDGATRANIPIGRLTNCCENKWCT